MEEAEKMADRIAIMDNGKIIAEGSAEELKKQTNKQSLEDAFLFLTGKVIRQQKAAQSPRMRRRWR
jgi:ABC-2 type transport system ATP-binding protein